MPAAATMDEMIERPRWYGLRRRAGVLAAGAIGTAVLAAVAFETSGAVLRIPLDQVTVAVATQGVFRDTTAIYGTAVPRNTIVLDALEGGRVEEVMAGPGDRVTEGQPLVRFSNTELELEILSQEGRLIESVTQLQAYQQQLERNRGDNARALAEIGYNRTRVSRAFERRKPLAERGFVRREEMDQLSDELASIDRLQDIQRGKSGREDDLRTRQLPQIEEQLGALRASLTIIRRKLDALTLRAPASGQLSGTELRLGESRKRGERLGEIILDDGFRVRAEVDEFYLDRVRTGQTAILEVGDGRARMTVTRIHPQVESGRFAIDLEFAGSQPAGIVAGQAIRGSLSLGQDRRALLLPAGAFLAEGGGEWAFVLGADGKTAERRRIRIGRRTSEQIEILGGLRRGDRVIVSSYDGWRDIQRIVLEN